MTELSIYIILALVALMALIVMITSCIMLVVTRRVERTIIDIEKLHRDIDEHVTQIRADIMHYVNLFDSVVDAEKVNKSDTVDKPSKRRRHRGGRKHRKNKTNGGYSNDVYKTMG